MNILSSVINQYNTAMIRTFERRDSLSIPSKLAVALTAAALTGLAAQIRFYLPWTPVPVTGQVFAVLLCGALLGSGYGALSQIFYLGLGYAGLPWFAGFSAGSVALFGMRGGYLMGFVPAALFTGLLIEKTPSTLLRPLIISFLMLGAVAIIYIFGAIQFAAFTGAGIYTTMSLAVIPFVLGDIVKALIAGLLVSAIIPGK